MDEPENSAPFVPSPEMRAEAERLGLEFGRVFGPDSKRPQFLYSFPLNRCGGTTIAVSVHGAASDLTRLHDETVAKWEVFEYPDAAETPAMRFPWRNRNAA